MTLGPHLLSPEALLTVLNSSDFPAKGPGWVSSQPEVRLQVDLSLAKSLHPSWQPGLHIYDRVSTKQVRPPDGPLLAQPIQVTLTFPQVSPEPYLPHPSLPTSQSPPEAIFLSHLHRNAVTHTSLLPKHTHRHTVKFKTF